MTFITTPLKINICRKKLIIRRKKKIVDQYDTVWHIPQILVLAKDPHQFCSEIYRGKILFQHLNHIPLVGLGCFFCTQIPKLLLSIPLVLAAMANRTDPSAKNIRGTNPQNLIEKIVRTKIYNNTYWKEQCFGLTAETLVDKAMELDHIGGTFGGNRKPTPFMCLVMKMLQIQPEKEIVIEFIKNDDYK